MIALLMACLFFEILVHVLNIASAKAHAKTVFTFPLVSYELSFAKSKEKLKIAYNILCMKFDRVERGLNNMI